MKTCAVKASVSASDGDRDGEETPGAEDFDPLAFITPFAPLKPAGPNLHPIMVSKAVGVFARRAVVGGEEAAIPSAFPDARLPAAIVLSLVPLALTGGFTFSRKLGAPSRRA